MAVCAKAQIYPIRQNKIIISMPGNSAPYIPSQPDGPTGRLFERVKVGNNYTYTTSTIDPDGDKVSYNWSWGDGTYSGWSLPVLSGVIVPETHWWIEPGTYEVKVKAKDIHDAESDWSPALIVTVSDKTTSISATLVILGKYYELQSSN